jgi:hypothetical protein
MTADELLERSSSRLLTEYQVLYQIKDEETERRRQGREDEERPDSEDDDDDS